MKKVTKSAAILAAFAAAIAAASFARAESSSTTTSPDAGKPLKSVTCPPECGFQCKSRNQKELTQIIEQHAKSVHGLTLTDSQVVAMMKTEPEPAKATASAASATSSNTATKNKAEPPSKNR